MASGYLFNFIKPEEEKKKTNTSFLSDFSSF